VTQRAAHANFRTKIRRCGTVGPREGHETSGKAADKAAFFPWAVVIGPLSYSDGDKDARLPDLSWWGWPLHASDPVARGHHTRGVSVLERIVP
jgi:hypothetical protein